MQPIVIATFYKFVELEDYVDLRAKLLAYCQRVGVKGTILLAKEGVNGTICGFRDRIDQVLLYLKADPRLNDLSHKESFDDKEPFYRMRVKLKEAIVKLGVDGIDPRKIVGTYVSPTDWNPLIQDPEVLVLDVRNRYEIAIGSFTGAIDPDTNNFCEFPDYVRQHCDARQHKKVAMFCTGGIRCEKASSLMLEAGFEEVYHLDGGILNYLENIPEDDSLWWGDCFVFDNRVAVNHTLQKSRYDMCHACRRPIDEHDKCSDHFEEGVSCPYCFDALSASQKRRFAERQKQMQLAKQRGEVHLGAPPPTRQQN